MNLAAGDGCSPTCEAEHGYICFNIPSVCSTVCGDGLIGGVEQCDDSNGNAHRRRRRSSSTASPST